MKTKPSVLVVDDDLNVVDWLVDALSDEGFAAQGETSATAALQRLAVERFDAVVSDVEMPALRGIDLLRAILAQRPDQAVVLITGFGSIDLAMEAVRAGAADFLPKPFRIEALVLSLERALREREVRRELGRLRSKAGQHHEAAHPTADGAGLVAQSPAMQRVLDLARRAARSHLPVLLTGESGVGKGAVARFVHHHSARSTAEFVQMNCAALPGGIAEAELFGVRRGAFTDAREDRPGVFEQAHRGTLFLDEVGELPLEVQPKLLQALETGKVRPLGGRAEVDAAPRLVAATNRPLEVAMAERSFRPDLYHRLNVIRIEIPPLRERRDDIEPLVDRVLDGIGRRAGRAHLGLKPNAWRLLRDHPWPGNVRALINAVERAAALSEHDLLGPEDFELELPTAEALSLDAAAAADWSLAELEQAYIRRVLARTGGHKAQAAQILGLDRRTLYRKVAEAERAHDALDPEVSPPPNQGRR